MRIEAFTKYFWRIYYNLAPVSVLKTQTDVMKCVARKKGLPLKEAKKPKVTIWL